MTFRVSPVPTRGLRAALAATLALLLSAAAIVASPTQAHAQFNPNEIDWTVVDTFVGPAGNLIPLRVGQHDSDIPVIGGDGFGQRHIVDGHGVVPPSFDIQETILSDCEQSFFDNRIRCHNPNTLLFVVYNPLFDLRSGDELPFGIITAFYMLPGCELAGPAPMQDCPADPVPTGLEYTGPAAAVNGESLTASAFLHDNFGTQLPGNQVSFALGTGASQQACSGTTDDLGVATCTIDSVSQPPGPTIPLEIGFAGNAGLLASQLTADLAVQSPTSVEYIGDEYVANGTGSELAAVLVDAHLDQPVPDRSVTFTLGEAQPQTCTATTDAAGTATCTIDSVDQPLTADATVPVEAAFEGDAAYLASSDADELLLEYHTGSAFGTSANVDLPLLPPINLPPQPDTGEIRTAHPQQTNVGCTGTIDAVVVVAGGLCPAVSTTLNPGTMTAVSEVAEATVQLPGIATIEVSGLTAEATSSCAGASGSTSVTLTINGEPVDIGDGTNVVIDLPAGGAIIVNEQQPAASGEGIAVNGVRISGLAGPTGIVLAYAESTTHNCPPQ